MKKAITLILIICLTLAACYPAALASEPAQGDDYAVYDASYLTEIPDEDWDLYAPSPSKNLPEEVEYSGLSDPKLIDALQRSIMTDLTKDLDPSQYRVEGVSAVYISKEYLEELAYNSQVNVFFGYTLAELDEEFQGTRYVFTSGEDDQTTVIPFEAYDDTYERALKNVAIGTGVILVCVTVSVVTGGVGAPAVSMIFAASAKTGAVMAASSGAISAVMAGAVTGVQTGDFDAALKAGALAGSESFKWGAISGAVIGGGTELVTLSTAARGGLTMNEAATIIKESGLPSNFVRQIKSMDDYYELVEAAARGGMTIQDMSAICMSTGYPLDAVRFFRCAEENTIYFDQCGLVAKTINGQTALVRTIDLTYESELAGEMVTNLERMRRGYAAIDPLTGKAFELHHIGQQVNSPLAILTQAEHRMGGNFSILHDTHIEEGVHKLLSDADWAAQVREFWMTFAETCIP